MVKFILKIFDRLRKRRSVVWVMMLVLTAVLAILMTRQTYKEDISDFLPLDNKYNKAMKVFQNISGAERIVTVFQYKDSLNPDQDAMVEAIECFVDKMQDDSLTANVEKMITQVDMEQVTQITDFVYENIPYFLDEQDYARYDSLLAQPQFYTEQLQHDKEMLMLPVAGMFAANVQKDPLNLFTDKLAKLQQAHTNVGYETYDGYIFSEDKSRAVIMFDSPHGSSETEKNALMLDQLEKMAGQTEAEFKDVDIRFAGGPVIAVGNAKQIKADSMLSVMLAVILIVALLLIVFRNMKNLLLIVVSIAWGWLFAMGGLALVHNDVSIIVIGISSVIIGIAVNYPLHMIAHLNHTTDVRNALKEIVVPLLVGNITTVGAFLALVPLKSVALRDLGLFSSFLLIGTIIFVLLFLPHLLKSRKQPVKTKFIDRIGDFKFENKRWIVIPIVVLTAILGYYSLHTKFDPNIRNINFMTESQKKDMEYFQKMMDNDDGLQRVYVVADNKDADKALELSEKAQENICDAKKNGLIANVQSAGGFLTTQKKQKHRLELWKQFKDKYKDSIIDQLKKTALQEDFAEDSFDEFLQVFENEYKPQDLDFFAPLTENVFATNIINDKNTGDTQIVDVVLTEKENVNEVVNNIEKSDANLTVFDIDGLNSSIATNLSNDFNYIGWACGLIVFFFLWFSFGSFELATLSFLPMACSWVWILGIMALMGINFNVVNVILATFIFGQGDDYTIFMTEGCQYEYAHRKKMLASYKSSIIISALIMFIGIGTLIFAQHPALKSLAQVTIGGMFSVVLMAYTLPPLIYNWLVKQKDSYRLRPIYLRPWITYVWIVTRFCCRRFVNAVSHFFVTARRKPEHRIKCGKKFRNLMIHDIKYMASVSFGYDRFGGQLKTAFEIYNKLTSFDLLYITSKNQNVVFVTQNQGEYNWLTKTFISCVDDVMIIDEDDMTLDNMRRWISNNYSIITTIDVFKNKIALINECDKSFFSWIRIKPVTVLHSELVIQPYTPCIYKGFVSYNADKYIEKLNTESKLEDVIQNIEASYNFYAKATYHIFSKETESTLKSFVIDRYRFKGIEITREVKHNINSLKTKVDLKPLNDNAFVIQNAGWGEIAMFYALAQPDKTIYAVEDDEEKQTVAKIAAESIAPNINFVNSSEIPI